MRLPWAALAEANGRSARARRLSLGCSVFPILRPRDKVRALGSVWKASRASSRLVPREILRPMFGQTNPRKAVKSSR